MYFNLATIFKKMLSGYLYYYYYYYYYFGLTSKYVLSFVYFESFPCVDP
jgi:hypothetical protein